MAESQAPYSYTPQLLQDLEVNLSSPRFAAYVKRAGHHREYAVQLYLYNARLAKSMLFPLHIMEVALRNGIDTILTSMFGNSWPNNLKFRQMLTPESNNAIQKTINRFSKIPSKDDIVSELSLDFWSNLFRPHYDRSLWQTNMAKLFPCASVTRASFQSEIHEVNRFRNRIAHHEPILDMDINRLHRTVINIACYRSTHTGDWAKTHSTVPNMLRTKPKANSQPGPFISDIVDKTITRVNINATLEELISNPATFYVANDSKGHDLAVFDNSDIIKFVSLARDCELVDLRDHTVDNLITTLNCANNFVHFSGNESLITAAQALKKKVRFIAILDPGSNNKIAGVVVKAHRRY